MPLGASKPSDGTVPRSAMPAPISTLATAAAATNSRARRRCAIEGIGLARVADRRFDVVDGVDDQDYRGTGNGPPIIGRAVVETRGIVTYTDLPQGSYPFAPLFCASSGGYTRPGNNSLRGSWVNAVPVTA